MHRTCTATSHGSLGNAGIATSWVVRVLSSRAVASTGSARALKYSRVGLNFSTATTTVYEYIEKHNFLGHVHVKSGLTS